MACLLSVAKCMILSGILIDNRVVSVSGEQATEIKDAYIPASASVRSWPEGGFQREEVYGQALWGDCKAHGVLAGVGKRV